MKNSQRRNILVLTSNFPRWEGDSTTPFVAQFCQHIAKSFANVLVLAPHAKGAATKEHANGVAIKRFRYFYPASQQTIAYDGGAVAKIGKSPMYAVKLLCFMVSLFYNTLFAAWFKKTDIINAHWIIPLGFVAVLAKFVTGKKVVITVHGGDVFSLTGRWFTRIKRFVLRHADAVVVNSSATLKACQDIYGNRTYTVIPMGIDVAHFKPRPASKELIRKYSLNDFTVLFVGRLNEDKGVLYLCQALNQLKSKHEDFKALIVGDGPYRAKLRSYIQENNLTKQVIFIGWIDTKDIMKFYNVADVFVGPSIVAKSGWREALGLVFVEALASGLPVIATRTGGIADVVEDGKTGFLVPQKSANEIYEKLCLLYEDPLLRKKMAEGGRQKMVEKFSWQSVTERYGQVFDGTIH